MYDTLISSCLINLMRDIGQRPISKNHSPATLFLRYLMQEGKVFNIEEAFYEHLHSAGLTGILKNLWLRQAAT